jgi:hypothetical protein
MYITKSQLMLYLYKSIYFKMIIKLYLDGLTLYKFNSAYDIKIK